MTLQVDSINYIPIYSDNYGRWWIPLDQEGLDDIKNIITEEIDKIIIDKLIKIVMQYGYE